MGAQLKGLARLVETDVAVVADAQQLQVDAADALDDSVIAGALALGIHVGAVGQVDGFGADVDQIEQVAVHEAPVAFGMLLGQAAVLVQVDAGDLGEVQVALVVPLDQLFIGTHGGAAGGQAQHAVGFHDDLSRDDVGSLAGHVIVVFRADDFHRDFLLIIGAGRWGPPFLLTLYYTTIPF